MPRKIKERCCRLLENETIFKPAGIPLSELEIVELNPDEIEALRLCEYEGYNQIEAGEKMNISRGTVQRLLISGKKKLLDSLLHQKAIKLKNSNTEKVGDGKDGN